MTRFLGICVCALLCFLGACVHPKMGGVLVIEPACLVKPLELRECEFKTEPPICKRVRLEYRKGCATIRAK